MGREIPEGLRTGATGRDHASAARRARWAREDEQEPRQQRSASRRAADMYGKVMSIPDAAMARVASPARHGRLGGARSSGARSARERARAIRCRSSTTSHTRSCREYTMPSVGREPRRGAVPEGRAAQGDAGRHPRGAGSRSTGATAEALRAPGRGEAGAAARARPAGSCSRVAVSSIRNASSDPTRASSRPARTSIQVGQAALRSGHDRLYPPRGNLTGGTGPEKDSSPGLRRASGKKLR